MAETFSSFSQKAPLYPTATKTLPCKEEGRGGGKVFLSIEGGGKICFYFSLSYSDLIVDELNSLFSPRSICFVRDGNW